MNEFDVLETGALEERFDIGHLAKAEFEHEESTGNKGCMRGGNQSSVDGEAVFSAEQRDGRLMFADFDGD
jgi:hypothetical protein